MVLVGVDMWPVMLAVGISLAGNVWLARSYLKVRDELVVTSALVTSAERQRDTAQTTALECGNAVDALYQLSEKRAKESALARAQAAAQSHAAAQRADAILSTPPAVPGDDSQSARARIDVWLQWRVKP